MDDIVELLDNVITLHGDDSSTHHTTCYQYHAACLAIRIRVMLKDITSTPD